jgi:predicted ATPase/DNA-binding SARP family transcriptional activator
LEVVGAGDDAVSLGRAQERAVLALLLIRAPDAISRDRLVDALWGERPPPTAAHAVQVYVSGIRKLLRAGGGDVAVRSSLAGYALEVDPDQIDASRFERLIHRAQRTLGENPPESQHLFDRALESWRGPPLAEFQQYEWARREADRLEELRTVALEGLAELRLACGEHRELIGTLTSLVASNPLREGPRRLLMLALYHNGRHADALACYRDACTALDEIGLEPSVELRRLEAAMLRHDPSLKAPTLSHSAAQADDSARPESPRAVRPSGSRLPVPARGLIGRNTEMSMVRSVLARGDTRLVTLLGPGGSGKTRLALEVARKLDDHYRDGVQFVSLGPLGAPALVASEIARTLGIAEPARESLPDALAYALEARNMLLVLDNFEHLLPAAELVGKLLAVASELVVLVTSRAALRITGEHRIDVPPLPLTDAVDLFIAQARAVRHDLAVGAPERDAVQRICRRVDRLPLALELAAARVAILAIPALDARLAQRLDLPEGPHDLPARQRTLRATIDWSYALLTSQEQALFCGLSVFAGGARLDAIEAVFGDLTDGPLEAVAGLVDKSLLRRTDDPDGEPRFWMLETIRERASEHLTDRGEADKIAGRHAAYFLGLAEEGDQHIHSSDQGSWISRLDADHDNLRAAFDYLVAAEPSDALQMGAALGYFWDIHGHQFESRERLERALAAAPREGGSAARASLFVGRSTFFQGHEADSEPFFAHMQSRRYPKPHQLRCRRCSGEPTSSGSGGSGTSWGEVFSRPPEGTQMRYGRP